MKSTFFLQVAKILGNINMHQFVSTGEDGTKISRDRCKLGGYGQACLIHHKNMNLLYGENKHYS